MLKLAKVLCLIVAIGACAGCSTLYNYAGGNFKGSPGELDSKVSPLAKELIAEARMNMIPGAPFDDHFHILGLGTQVESICPEIQQAPNAGHRPPDTQNAVWLNSDYLSWLHPILRLKLGVFMSAAGVTDLKDADAQYVNRVRDLVRHSGGTHYLYAMDWHYDGAPGSAVRNVDKSDIYVGNEFVIALSACLNRLAEDGGRFVPVASIHPYKATAIDELHVMANAGIRYLKWLPPAQGIDPANHQLVPFYEAMRDRGVTLLSHTGDEHTFRVEDDHQDLADPIRLSLPVQIGVTVVMLHSGRDGRERHSWPGDGARRDYSDRFVEIMHTYRDKNLFGEISAVPYLRTHSLLKRLLVDENIRCRLLDGTDYPNPAVSLIRPTANLLNAGYLKWPGDQGNTMARARKRALDEIYSYNPLLFDFVMKRTIRIDGTPLPAAAFYDLNTKLQNPTLGCP